MAWEEWFQDIAGSVIDKAAQAKFVQPYEIDRMRIQQLGQLGTYQEGQPMQQRPQQVGGMSEGTILLIGGVLLAVLMLKD